MHKCFQEFQCILFVGLTESISVQPFPVSVYSVLEFDEKVLCFVGLLFLFSHSVVSDSLQPHELQHARPPCSTPTPGAHPNPCPLSQWCHPAISSCLQSFPASESFQMSQFSASGGQSIRVPASASVLPVNIQDWFPLGLIGWISLQSKGLSRVFSNTTVQKHQFFSTQPYLWSSSQLSHPYGPTLTSICFVGGRLFFMRRVVLSIIEWRGFICYLI